MRITAEEVVELREWLDTDCGLSPDDVADCVKALLDEREELRALVETYVLGEQCHEPAGYCIPCGRRGAEMHGPDCVFWKVAALGISR